MQEKILIVDDDRDSLKLIGLMLQRQGYMISAAQSGVQALAKAESELPDLIILDVMMPDMDGFEVCRRLRSNPKTAHTPIIMFTAKTQVTDKVAGFQAGADDYLTKPVHPAELSSRVESLLLRSARVRAEAAVGPNATIIGFLGSKGGVGTTTMAVNTAVVVMQQETGQNKRVVVAEMVPGGGGAGLMLGFERPTGLAALTSRPLDELDQRMVESQLSQHPCGLNLLLAPLEPRGGTLPTAHATIIVQHLAHLCDYLFLDLGSGLTDTTRAIAKLCQRVVLLVEPQRVSVMLGLATIGDLAKADVPRHRISLVIANRVPSASSVTRSTVEGLMGEVACVIPPAPELAFQAMDNGVPLYTLQPASLVSMQFRELAKAIMPK